MEYMRQRRSLAFDTFARIDRDKNGTVDRSEFKAGLKGMGFHVDVDEFEKLWRHFDKDNSGQIDLNEFKGALNQNSVKKPHKSKNNSTLTFRVRQHEVVLDIPSKGSMFKPLMATGLIRGPNDPAWLGLTAQDAAMLLICPPTKAQLRALSGCPDVGDTSDVDMPDVVERILEYLRLRSELAFDTFAKIDNVEARAAGRAGHSGAQAMARTSMHVCTHVCRITTAHSITMN